MNCHFNNLITQTRQMLHNPRPADIRRLEKVAMQNPDLWKNVTAMARRTREMLVNKVWPGEAGKPLLNEIDDLMRLLGNEASSSIELLIIESIILSYVRLLQTEQMYLTATEKSIPLAHAAYWESALTQAQRRFLRALETLARVRRLAKQTPSLLVNIAATSGQPINVTSDQTTSSF